MSIIVGGFHLSPELFRTTNLRNSCIEQCNSNCCNGGVSITVQHVERIKEYADELQPYFIEPYDFNSWDTSRGADLGTPLLNENMPGEQCWFLRSNRLCGLHTFALDKGIPAFGSVAPTVAENSPLEGLTRKPLLERAGCQEM